MSIRIPLPTPGAQARQSARLPLGLPGARAPMATVDDRRGAALTGLAGVFEGVTDSLHEQESARLREARAAQAALEKEQSVARISKQVSDSALYWTQEQQRMADEAAPGAPEFTPTLLKSFDEYWQGLINDAPESDRAALTEASISQRTRIGTAALTFEATKQREHLINLYRDGALADAATLALSPAGYADIRSHRLAALAASNLPADVRAALRADTESTLAHAAGRAMLTNDPAGVLAAMTGVAKGETPARGFEWLAHLAADARLQLRSQAQAEVDRRENQARIAAGQREAAAAGALNAYTQQLALGIPPRTEDLNQWRSLIKGSDHEAEFNRLQQGYGQVQSLLAKPVAEQVEALQAMQERLATEGGNAQDVKMLQLAQTALSANIQMQTQAPLQWAAQFADIPIEPLDVAMLATEDGAQAFAATLDTRAHTIAALQQQNPGVAITPALLQPQEAQALVAAFGAGNAREAGQLLAALMAATGSDNTARQDALFAQLEASGAGEAQDLVRIAALAISDAQATLKSKWFDADVIQSGADTAATVLDGRDIVRANGQVKDGPRFTLPQDADFMAKVVKEVGTAYGSPVAGDSGYEALLRDAQIIKYWYVAEAARSGKLDKDVNGGVLEQAIAAVVGEVATVNDSKIILPRGMDEARFGRHVNLAIEEGLKAAGLWADGLQATDYGLVTLGAGRYMVTLGDMSTGLTVHIDPADTARDGAAEQWQAEKNEAQKERTRRALSRSRERYLQSLDNNPLDDLMGSAP